MNKAELIDAMAKGAGLTKADAKKALEAFVDATSKALKKNPKKSLIRQPPPGRSSSKLSTNSFPLKSSFRNW